MVQYTYIRMPALDFFRHEALEEILRERANFYTINKKDADFWILMNPESIDSLESTRNQSSVNDYITLISTSSTFIAWLKLRLGFPCDPMNLNSYSFELESSKGLNLTTLISLITSDL